MYQEMGANPLFTKPKCCVSGAGTSCFHCMLKTCLTKIMNEDRNISCGCIVGRSLSWKDEGYI